MARDYPFARFAGDWLKGQQKDSSLTGGALLQGAYLGQANLAKQQEEISLDKSNVLHSVSSNSLKTLEETRHQLSLISLYNNSRNFFQLFSFN